MKKTFKIIGIIALAAVIGFSFASCDEGGYTQNDLQGTWRWEESPDWKTLAFSGNQVTSSQFYPGVSLSVVSSTVSFSVKGDKLTMNNTTYTITIKGKILSIQVAAGIVQEFTKQ
jgi:hypothetical protein